MIPVGIMKRLAGWALWGAAAWGCGYDAETVAEGAPASTNTSNAEPAGGATSTGSAMGGATTTGGTATAAPKFAFCEHADTSELDAMDESDLGEPVVSAGFVDIPATSYSFLYANTGEWESRESDSARLFYSFVPANEAPKSAPLFLFFNGGPGGSTTNALRAHGTSPKVINETTGDVEDNPYSWSTLGNLLYVDARQTGFSYSTQTGGDGQAGSTLPAVYDDSSFNEYVDAADFARILLAIYDQFPSLENNPLIVVGESYGGIRAQHLLNALRDPSDLETGNDGHYVDPALAAALAGHNARVNARRRAAGLESLEPGAQFAWQILIEPAIVFSLPSRRGELPEIAAFTSGIAASLEAHNAPQEESSNGYNIIMSSDELRLREATTVDTLLTPAGFTNLFGVEPHSLVGMPASDRFTASRRTDCAYLDDALVPTPSTEWISTLGDLGACDAYFVSIAPSSSGMTHLANSNGWQSGALFLKNLKGVHSFITRALLDGTIVADAIPWHLRAYIPGNTDWGVENPYAISGGAVALSDVEGTTKDIDGFGLERPAHFDVTYEPESPDAAPLVRRVRFPTYADAGHEVAAWSPDELYADVRAFLCNPEAGD